MRLRAKVKIVIALAALAFSATVFGADPKAPVASQAPVLANAPSAGVARTAAMLEIKREVTLYNSANIRDPFLSIVKAAKQARESKRQDAGAPLESYDLRQIEKGLVAIIWDKAKSYALVGLPDGKFYTLREGMKLGIHGGTVYRISKDRIIVREMLQDFRGELKPQDTIIMLHKEEG